jgi:LmbE family N-acetylglucosaminyl deacetylase
LSHPDRPSIGCIFAHPDDETFCVGGIVAKYAAAGHEVHLWCATDGDAGKNAGVPVSSPEQLAALRRRELADAARILGISSVELGHYRDGELARADPTSLVADIVGFIRRRRPTVILTFGPEGAPTGHADHAATSRVATAAFFLSGLATSHPDQNLPPHHAARLYFHAWDFPLAEKRLKLESVPGVGTARIDVRAFKEKKSAAFAAHATQQGSSGVFFSSAFPDVEVLAFAAGVPQPAPIVDDVFAGLSGLDG